jgi:hypothetical protein
MLLMIGCVKIGDLRKHRAGNYTFDLDHMIDIKQG